jgi:hypothetical protein
MVASLLSRSYPDPVGDQELPEFRKLMLGVRNNIPGLLEEMKIGAGGQKLARISVPDNWSSAAGGFARVSGPLVSRYMWMFAAKLGLALHFESTGTPIPCSGALRPRWYSNVDHLRGEIPRELLDALPEPLTLRQGRKEVSDQFEYSCRVAPDLSFGLYFATFRNSFAVACIAMEDGAPLFERAKEGWPAVSPPIFCRPDRTPASELDGADFR